jgi:hypothetical protein
MARRLPKVLRSMTMPLSRGQLGGVRIGWQLLPSVLGVLPGRGLRETGLTVSPDERWLLYAKREVEGSHLLLVEKFR